MDIVKTVTDFFSGSEAAIILKLVLGLFGAVSIIFLGIWLKAQAVIAAQKATADKAAQDQADLDAKNKKIFDDAQKAEDDINNIIKNKGTPT